MTPAQPMLEGIRIVDMTSIVFGPYATQMLADLGAEVIKVEPPGGDQLRYVGKPQSTRRMSPPQFLLNRGKKSVVLDLKDADDAEAMRRLLATADVFIHNVRAEPIARLGFDYAAVKALRPDIVYVHCVGFGSTGPYAGLQAYDDVIQAATGAASLLPRVDGDERPRYVPSLIADKVAGLYGAQAVLAAIIHRLRTGEGQFVEAPMFESFAQFILLEHLFGHVFAEPVEPTGYPRQLDPNRQPFPTADGYISIVPYTAESTGRLMHLIGRADLLQDPRFATPREQAKNMSAFYVELAKITPSRTTAEWVEALSAASIPCMPVREMDAMRDDPHLQAVDFFHRRSHPTEADYVEMRLPIAFSAAPPREVAPPALLGQHTDALRAELGLPPKPKE